MKEQVLLYGICAAISIGAVAVTSLAKMIVTAIAAKHGKDISGNVKEYVFTPIALILAAIGQYFWLSARKVPDGDQFILTVAAFTIGTMLIYWLIFQPTRKLAVAIIRAFVKKAKLEPVADAVQDAIKETDKPEKSESSAEEERKAPTSSTDAAASLQALVESIKKK